MSSFSLKCAILKYYCHKQVKAKALNQCTIIFLAFCLCLQPRKGKIRTSDLKAALKILSPGCAKLVFFSQTAQLTIDQICGTECK